MPFVDTRVVFWQSSQLQAINVHFMHLIMRTYYFGGFFFFWHQNSPTLHKMKNKQIIFYQIGLQMQTWKKCLKGAAPQPHLAFPKVESPSLSVHLHHQRALLSHVILTCAKSVANSSSNVYTALAQACKASCRVTVFVFKEVQTWAGEDTRL